MTAAEFVDQLNHDYERVHTSKEDAFWTAYMGLSDDADKAQADLDEREKAHKAFLQDPGRLEEVRRRLDGAEGETRVALKGWERTLAANVIDSGEGRALAAEIIDAEGRLARARGKMKLGYAVPGAEFVEASSNELATMIGTDEDEARRKAAWEGLCSIEDRVLANGYVEVVRMRNRLGRMLGAEDYYDWRVKCVEGVSKQRVFELLDELERNTRKAAAASLASVRGKKGDVALLPWNLGYFTAGDVTRELDPYFPFELSYGRWGRSFAALGVDYNGAEMVLDLVSTARASTRTASCTARCRRGATAARSAPRASSSRPTRSPAWSARASARPRRSSTRAATPRTSRTSTCRPRASRRSSRRHRSRSPRCRAMFLDSVLSDADWRTRYAKTKDGEPMPFELIERAIRASQPMAAHALRRMLTIPYCEKAIYEIPDEELSADAIRAVVEKTERDLLGLDRSPRPALSVPHLLAGESSAYYHGYVMALVGVEQTRDYFIRRDGHLLDNPRIGPDLREAYWRPGNSKDFFTFVEDLTGSPVSASALSDRANRTVDEAIDEARSQISRLPGFRSSKGPVELGGKVRVMHGNETVTDGDTDFETAANTFADWVSELR